MRRVYLLVGDKSVVGGVITEGLPGMTNNGRAISFVGATVACPVCQSPGHIVATGSRLPGEMFGKQVALDGDVCACKCVPPPRMMASDATMWQDVDGDAAAASSSADIAGIAAGAAVAASALASSLPGQPTTAQDAASTPLAGEPFSYTPLPAVGDATQQAARGVSEHDEAECHDQYERDMDACTALRSAMGGKRWMDMCSQRAFDRYQTCRGY
ncbi:PAAR domain-containing protein [Burkholderia gladioli]|uniref:PAAR domain-containing protein n=1 Tax=Burkholderia gladioli TaxID=28095 RepID=UPI003B5020B4